MLLIRVTQKLQKEIGVVPVVPCAVSSALFEEWYAHVFMLNRKKQVIFVETQTLFSFCIGGVSRKEIREELPVLFERNLGNALHEEGAGLELTSRLLSVCRDQFVYAKTESKRVLAVSNEFIRQHKVGFHYMGRALDVVDQENRHMFSGGFPGRGYEMPISVFAEKVKENFDLDFFPLSL